MDKLWKIAGADLEDSSGDGQGSYGHERDREEDEEEEEEEEEDASQEGTDVDEDQEERPVKRHRLGKLNDASPSPGSLDARASGDRLGDVEEDGDEDEQEVIEILSDDEDARSPAGLGIFPFVPRHQSRSPFDPDSTPQIAQPDAIVKPEAHDWASAGGASAAPSASGASKNTRTEPTAGQKRDQTRWHARKLTLSTSRFVPARAGPGAAATAAAVAASPRGSSSDGGASGDADRKPPAQGIAGARDAWGGSCGASGAPAGSKSPPAQGVGFDVGRRPVAGTAMASEFPRNLECAMCFNPIAVVALFACGHGSCWECAHEWCARGKTATMDCPTCHVSVPRNDFRRCVVLDEVVERAVIDAELDDKEWDSRLERGQDLSRQAEASRRGARDAQRSAEDIIAEQAAELERLREEARPRAPIARSRRGHDSIPPSMADYGFRIMSGRHLLDSSSQRSAEEEFARIRHRRTSGGEPLATRTPSAASDAAAAALGMPPSAYGGVRSRAQPPSATSMLGHAGEDPWFSLRPSQPNRQLGVSMRLGRDALAASNASARSAAHSAAAGLGSSSGAVLKTARERRYPSYAGPGGGGRIPGSASGDSQHPLADVRERAAALSSYYPVSSVATIPASFTPAAPPAESRGQPGAGRRPASQPPPPRPSRRTFGLGGPHRGAAGAIAATPAAAAASASASYSAAAAGSTGPSFGSFDRFGVRLSAAATPSGARFDEADSDLEPLEMIAGHDDFGSRSEWDDVLAAVSMPHQAAEESADDSRD